MCPGGGRRSRQESWFEIVGRERERRRRREISRCSLSLSERTRSLSLTQHSIPNSLSRLSQQLSPSFFLSFFLPPCSLGLKETKIDLSPARGNKTTTCSGALSSYKETEQKMREHHLRRRAKLAVIAALFVAAAASFASVSGASLAAAMFFLWTEVS